MNSNTVIESSQLPVIAGHEIPMDEHGRFNLNAIHSASGESSHKLPSQWARRGEAKELIAELKSQSVDLHFEPLSSVRGGAHRGTYAHELLAVSYAGWISPRFQLQVNQVFLDYRMGKLNRVAESDAAEPKRIGKTTTQDRAPLKQLVNTIVDARTRRGHPSDYSSAWREINGYLGLESIQDATHEQIETGITFARKILEGELCSPQASLPGNSRELDIHYPMSRWPEINHGLAFDWKNQVPQGHKDRRIWFVRPGRLCGDMLDHGSPTMLLLRELTDAGYNVECCQAEINAMRSTISELDSLQQRILQIAKCGNAYPLIVQH